MAGLNATQYEFEYSAVPSDADKSILPAAFGWIHLGSTNEADTVCKPSDMVVPLHPVYVIPFEAVENARQRFSGRSLS